MLIANRTSEAYDYNSMLSLFDTPEKKRTQDEKPEIQIKHGTYSRAKSGSVMKILLVAICAVLLPMYFLSSKVELSELSGKISNEQIALEKAQSENLRLQAELDNLITLANVEHYAKYELGMQKVTISQGRHISLGTGGTTEIADNTGSPVSFVSDWFSDMLEFLGFR